MTTGSQRIHLTTKKLVGYSDLDTGVLDYFNAISREAMQRTFRDGGVFDSGYGMAADGANKFKLTTYTNPATDGLGRLFQPTSSLVEGIQFENILSNIYHVALHFAERPRGIAINPRNGSPEYRFFEEGIGEAAAPNSVADNGNGTITFIVNNATQAGVSMAGRKVLVWKVIPAAGALTEAIAVEELTVVYTGGNNQVTTTGALGQSTISTTPGDYMTMLLGEIGRASCRERVLCVV